MKTVVHNGNQVKVEVKWKGLINYMTDKQLKQVAALIANEQDFRALVRKEDDD